MNDILAPLFMVFCSEVLNVNYSYMENKYDLLDNLITPEKLIDAEADCYYCFLILLEKVKKNFFKGFKGVKKNIYYIEKVLKKMDLELFEHFEENQIEIFHFAFTWSFCLLLREFPILLSIKIIDYYLTEDVSVNNLCNNLILALILKFSINLKMLSGEEIIDFLQNIPTEGWGYQDITILVSEAYAIYNQNKKAEEKENLMRND